MADQVFQHPTFEDVRVNVSPEQAPKWREQGWKRVSRDLAPPERQEPTTVVLGQPEPGDLSASDRP